MQQFVIVVHLMIVLAMIGVVLLQKSEGGGLGVGGGGGFMTSRGSANVLTRATGMLAAAFFTTSLILSILAGIGRNPTTIIQQGGTAPVTAPAPGAPNAPLGQPGGGGGGLLDTLRQREGPQAPGPQVPQPQ